MPLTALTVSTSSRTAAAVLPASNGTAADVANGNSFANDGNTIVLATNTGSTVTRNVTIPLALTVDGQTPASKTYAIPISTTWILGKYDPTIYGSTVQINGDNAELKFNVVRVA